MNTTSERAWDVVIFTYWHRIFKDLCAQDDPMALSADDYKFQQAMEKNALATFIDAHNTSYYVNAYTTKVNPTMDDVLSKLLDGVRRLRDEWQDREAQAQGDSHEGKIRLRHGVTPPAQTSIRGIEGLFARFFVEVLGLLGLILRPLVPKPFQNHFKIIPK